jgi:aminopeptidase-like protein
MSNSLYNFAKKIQQFPRSLTGVGNRQTLSEIKKILPSLKTKRIKSGKKIFDWNIPDEWHVDEAYIIDPTGRKIVDIKKNILHLVGYSLPINKEISLEELQKFLHSDPKKPNAIPYVTSYYKKTWGFCLQDNLRKTLKKGKYKVTIKSSLKKGYMDYGEIYIKGKSKKEIFFSSYICHPFMANNEISGPSVLTYLLKELIMKKNKYFSVRAVFVPETIGSIAYIHQNLSLMKKNIFSGFNITCVGDQRCYSYIPSRRENTLSDKVALHALKWVNRKVKKYSWLERGSDERQYCSPGVDLPIASITKSKYGEYKEYHTSDDNFKTLVTKEGLTESLKLYVNLYEIIEKNFYPKAKLPCEPQLGKYNLYDPFRKNKYTKKKFNSTLTDPLYNMLSYCDGEHSLIDIANKLDQPVWSLFNYYKILIEKKILIDVSPKIY